MDGMFLFYGYLFRANVMAIVKLQPLSVVLGRELLEDYSMRAKFFLH